LGHGMLVSFSVLLTHCLAICSALISIHCFKYWWNLSEQTQVFANENIKLSEMNKELSHSVKQIGHRTTKLNEINRKLGSSLQDFTAKNDHLKGVNEDLAKSVKSFTQENCELTQSNNDLREVVRRFTAENQQLGSSNQKLVNSIDTLEDENLKLVTLNDRLVCQISQLSYVKTQLERWGKRTNSGLAESISRFRKLFGWFSEMGKQYTQNIKENWHLLLIRIILNISAGRELNSWQFECFKRSLPKEFLEYWDEECEFEALDEYEEGTIGQEEIFKLRNLLVERRFEEWSERNESKFPVDLLHKTVQDPQADMMSVSSDDENIY